MSEMRCPKCHGLNPLATLFCRHCGVKLVFPPSRGDRVRGGGLARRVRLALFLAVVAVAAAALWPIEPAGHTGTLREAELCQRKAQLLERAQAQGTALTFEFSEAEVNAYLGALLALRNRRAREAGAAERQPGAPVEAIRMDFTPEGVRVGVRVRYGPLPVSYEVLGVPEVGGGRLTFALRGARLGHLPLPTMLGDRVAVRVAGVFAGLERERRLLANLKALEIEGKLARVRAH